MNNKNPLYKLLSCPECHSKVKLNETKDLLLCQECKIEFTMENSIPVMLTPRRKEILHKEVNEWRGSENIPKFFSYKTIQLLKSPEPFKWLNRNKILQSVFQSFSQDGIYLDLGGVGCLHPQVLTVNITPAADTDMVCDGQFMPFQDHTVDGIFILLVLEHVRDPKAIADEISRVLKPGGFVFATIPFLQVMHANPKDYYRFTPDGIRELFPDFKELALEIASGPTGTIIWILKEYFALLCPFSNHSLVYVSVREIFGWLLYPLIILDFFLIPKRYAAKMASFFYYYGKRK